MAIIEVKVPDVGTDKPVDVIEVNVKPGDSIAKEQTIIVLESDKATVEVPSPEAGTVQSVAVKVGDKLVQGALILKLESGAATPVAAAPSAAAPSVAVPAAAAAPARGEFPAVAVPAPAVAAASQTVVFTVPDIGSDKPVDVIEISVKPGDSVAKEQTLIVLESDKATMEVPAEAAGRIVELLLKKGDKVRQGTPIARVEVSGGASAPVAAAPSPSAPAAAAPAVKAASPAVPVPAAPAAVVPNENVHAGPAVRKLARELGVRLGEVAGTGPKGRVLKDDVHAHVKKLLTSPARAAAPATGSGLPELPKIDFTKWGAVEEVALSKLRRVAAQNLHRAWLHIPHVTQHDEADISELEAFRVSENERLKAEGIKLTMLGFLVKACVVTLKQYPKFNSSLALDGEKLIVKNYWHIGIAVDTPDGLVVPVIRDADRKGVVEIAREMGELSKKARDKKLTPADMQGATFSISSLGGIGGTAFTPIVNWPEVAILGVSKSQLKPVWNGKKFEPKLHLPLSLSYDHRVIDGADAARFITYLSGLLGDLRRLSL